MPFTSIAPISSPSWLVDYEWPDRNSQTSTSVRAECIKVAAPVITRDVMATFGKTPRTLAAGGTGVSETMGYYRGLWALRLVTTSAVAEWIYGDIGMWPAIGAATSFPPGVITEASQRATWVSFTLAADAGAVLTSATGVALLNGPAHLTTQHWPGLTGQPNFGAFGIFGDGAGGLNFTAYDATTPGPANVLTQVAIPAPPAAGDWQSFEFFLTGGSSSRDSTLDVYVNGVALPGAQALRFTNAAGGLWWDPAATNLFQLALRQGTVGAAHVLRLANWRIRQGFFTRDGAELTD